MFGIKKSNFSVYWIAGSLSLLLSYWSAIREAIINPDAICYIESAAHMKYGLYAAIHLCGQAKWPFYSFLIFIVERFLPLSYESVAYVIDAFFSLASVLIFIKIVDTLSKNSRIVWLAAFTILLSHEFNAVRQYIVRDHGFWAFYLASIYFLIIFFNQLKWKHAVAWSISLLFATLFRIEGSIFLFLLPLVSFFDTRQACLLRIKTFFQLNAVTLILFIIACGIFILHPHLHALRLEEVSFQFTNGVMLVFQHFIHLKVLLAQTILGPDAEKEAGIVLFLMMISWYSYSIVTNVSFIYSFLIIIAMIKRLLKTDDYIRHILVGYLVVNFIITAVFFAEHNFLSKRYLIALSLILMIWVPFALDYCFLQWKTKKSSVVLIFLLIMVSSVGGIFDFGYSKQYIYDAGKWLSQHVPSRARLYANDYQLMYYSHHFGDDLFQKIEPYSNLKMISHQKWKDFDFLALRLRKKDMKENVSLVNEIHYPLVKVFENERGDQVRIYGVTVYDFGGR